MSNADIRSTVKSYLMEEFLPGEDPASITDETSLIGGGVLDSIATVKLTAHLEERYGVDLEAHEMSVDNLDTIASISSLVEKKLAAKG